MICSGKKYVTKRMSIHFFLLVLIYLGWNLYYSQRTSVRDVGFQRGQKLVTQLKDAVLSDR